MVKNITKPKESKFDEFKNKDKPEKDFIEENIYAIGGKKNFLRQHKKFYTGLISMNIPMLQKNTALKRRELYDFYTLFNALCIVTSQKYDPSNYDVSKGIDYEAFRNGLSYIFMQSTEISKRLFAQIAEQFSEYLDWPRFLQGMKFIRAKTLKEKLDLFIKIADSDRDGYLSYNEVHELCSYSLEHIWRTKEKQKEWQFLIDYFTGFIFKIVGYELDARIPLVKIRDMVLQNDENSDLLCMFCGADI